MIFWLRKEKKNDYPLDKDFVYIFEVIYANDEVNIKIGFSSWEYKHLTYFTDGILRYIYYSTR